MAIYYINPYTQTNGTGTFASPWSTSSTTRTGLADGDEIRILGNTVPLFLATSYTASRTSDTSMTISAGGGLGADWSAGNYGYIVEDDAFFYVSLVATNVLVVGSATPMHWSNTVLSTTNTKTIRKVDTANNGTSTPTGTMYILASGAISNVIVSDAWIDANTRVTDGSVKSIFRGAGATSSPTLYFENNASSTKSSNNFFLMQNSHVVPNPYTSSAGSINVRGKDSVYNIAQFTMYASSTSILSLGTVTYPSKNNTISIKNCSSYYIPISTSTYGDSNIVNITNYYCYVFDYFFGATGSTPANFTNTNINFANVTTIATGSSGWVSMAAPPSSKISINITNTIDWVPTTTPSYALSGGGGDVSLIFSPGITIFKGRRATTGATTLVGRYILGASGLINNKIPVYTANLLPSLTATSNVAAYPSSIVSLNSTSNSLYSSNDLKKPTVVNIEYPSSTSTANNAHSTVAVNILQTYRDGSWDPIEILGIDTKIGYVATASSASFPNVFRDYNTFRTSGPSLRSLLTTRTALYWLPTGNANETKSESYKNIKIPIVSGSNYTISGYIRSSYSLTTTADVTMSVIYNNTVLATQDMTSASFNSWEQFTLSFTATATGEAYLVWEMYYPTGGMSYWLDDLSITRT
jgi:hypothetical protein